MSLRTVGEALKALREEKKLSQRALGTAANTSASMICRIEGGDRNFNVDTLRDLLAVLDEEGGLSRLLKETDISGTSEIFRANKRLKGDDWQPRYVADTALAIGDVVVEEGVTIGHNVVLDATWGRIVVKAGVTIGHNAVVTTRRIDKPPALGVVVVTVTDDVQHGAVVQPKAPKAAPKKASRKK